VLTGEGGIVSALTTASLRGGLEGSIELSLHATGRRGKRGWTKKSKEESGTHLMTAGGATVGEEKNQRLFRQKQSKTGRRTLYRIDSLYSTFLTFRVGRLEWR